MSYNAPQARSHASTSTPSALKNTRFTDAFFVS
jgi:hypothetical protein